MNKPFLTALLSVCALFFSAAAADRLAVAEPVAKGGLPPAAVDSLWGMLESAVPSGEYTLVSRAALKQMLTEIGLVSSSGLIDLNSRQKAELGRVSGVKYILISEIGKFGSGINCTLRILDAATGELVPQRTANLRVNTLDELADRIDGALIQLLADSKELGSWAMLTPIIRAPRVPGYAAQEFNILLESELLNRGVRLQNLQSVEKILRKNRIDALDELEPKMFVRVGKLLEVRNLVQITLTRFETAEIRYHIEESASTGVRHIGYLDGSCRIIATRTGEVIAAVPFRYQINFRHLDRNVTRDWLPEDYGKFMIRNAVEKQILPGLEKSPAFKQK